MQLNQYFTHYTVPGKKNKIHIVMEHYSSEHQKVIGVISGVESVCVVNSGYGMNGDIRKYVEDILGTDKLIECTALTGQPADTGALKVFDGAYISDGEKKVYETAGTDDARRKAEFKELALNNPETVACGDALFMDNKGITFKPAGTGLSDKAPERGPHMFDKEGDGYLFHLGGTVVQMAELPAQSDSQLAALCPTCCIHFMGNGLGAVTHLENRDREGLVKYAECLQKIYDITTVPSMFAEGLGATPPLFYTASSPVPLGADAVLAIITAVKEVVEGHTAYDAPAGGKESCRMHFSGNYGIVYDRDKL